MFVLSLQILFVSIIFLFKQIGANELTFELPDNAKECFLENLKVGSKFVLEFQVVTGGNYDVDLELKSPSGKFYIKKEKNNMIKLKKLQKKMVFMNFVLVMNFQHFLIKLFILIG